MYFITEITREPTINQNDLMWSTGTKLHEESHLLVCEHLVMEKVSAYC